MRRCVTAWLKCGCLTVRHNRTWPFRTKSIVLQSGYSSLHSSSRTTLDDERQWGVKPQHSRGTSCHPQGFAPKLWVFPESFSKAKIIIQLSKVENIFAKESNWDFIFTLQQWKLVKRSNSGKVCLKREIIIRKFLISLLSQLEDGWKAWGLLFSFRWHYRVRNPLFFRWWKRQLKNCSKMVRLQKNN